MSSPALRRALVVLAALVPGTAAAADYGYPDAALRGSFYADPPPVEEVVRWQGGYLGAFAGYSQANFSAGKAVTDSIGRILRNSALETEHEASKWLALSDTTHRDGSFGGFVGYNFQMDEVVFGFEADWTRTRLHGSSSDTIARTASTSANGYFNEVYLTGAAKSEINDYGTLRARLGYTAGAFMPFLTGGLAVGYGRFSHTVGVQTAGYNQAAYDTNYANYLQTGVMGYVPNYGYSRFDPRNLAARQVASAETFVKTKETAAAGFAVGAGIDLAVTQNIFLRAEYQYVYLDNFEGNVADIHTVRAAAGVKF